MAPQVGLEPTTLRLTAECSTIELLRTKVDEFIPFNQTDGTAVKLQSRALAFRRARSPPTSNPLEFGGQRSGPNSRIWSRIVCANVLEHNHAMLYKQKRPMVLRQWPARARNTSGPAR